MGRRDDAVEESVRKRGEARGRRRGKPAVQHSLNYSSTSEWVASDGKGKTKREVEREERKRKRERKRGDEEQEEETARFSRKLCLEERQRRTVHPDRPKYREIIGGEGSRLAGRRPKRDERGMEAVGVGERRDAGEETDRRRGDRQHCCNTKKESAAYAHRRVQFASVDSHSDAAGLSEDSSEQGERGVYYSRRLLRCGWQAVRYECPALLFILQSGPATVCHLVAENDSQPLDYEDAGPTADQSRESGIGFGLSPN
ncbi:unnamed protein product [Pleuronectes platessa]|uniref:Uncharacterized protein n=1 Tax=Pleuronectes platessa TaxID=8262 RepID=A0A9N7THZ4_PLEPL|nr:unnamed protein product [Pleuronectes platessa]